MHRANRCYKQPPVPRLSATSESPPVWWAGRYDGPGGWRASPALQGLSSLSSPTRICWQFFQKTLFWREKRGLIHHQFKAPVKVHTLTILPNRHLSFVYCFPLYFHCYLFSKMAHLSSLKLDCCQLPGYHPFPHQLTTQEVSALMRHHWPKAESVSSCSGKIRELNLSEFQPAGKTNSDPARKIQSPDQSCSIS